MSLILAVLLMFTLEVKAQKFDAFLLSLDKNLPLNTQKLRNHLNASNTKLAHPSLLQKWGIINSTAEASYNGILNTVIVSPELTTIIDINNPQLGRRAKTWLELESANQLTFYVPMTTLFHELSHAEFDVLKKSKKSEDQNLIQLLNKELKNYLQQKHNLNFFDSHIAVSEMYAYFQGDFLMKLAQEVDEILISNGYNKYRKTCRVYPSLANLLDLKSIENRKYYILNISNVNYSRFPLPFIYVRGKEYGIDPSDQIYSKLQIALWENFSNNFNLPQSRKELVDWMNTKPEFLEFIAPCR